MLISLIETRRCPRRRYIPDRLKAKVAPSNDARLERFRFESGLSGFNENVENARQKRRGYRRRGRSGRFRY